MWGPESNRTTKATALPRLTVRACWAKSVAVKSIVFLPPPGVGRGVKSAGACAFVKEHAANPVVSSNSANINGKMTAARGVFMREAIPVDYKSGRLPVDSQRHYTIFKGFFGLNERQQKARLIPVKRAFALLTLG